MLLNSRQLTSNKHHAREVTIHVIHTVSLLRNIRISIYERLVRVFYAGFQMSAQIDGDKLKPFALVRRTVQVEKV